MAVVGHSPQGHREAVPPRSRSLLASEPAINELRSMTLDVAGDLAASDMMVRQSLPKRLTILSAKIVVGLQPVFVVVVHVVTNPWHCWSTAIQNILVVEDEYERRVLLSRWVENKKREYEYVGFAAAIIASTVTGSIQWPQLNGAHWFVFALLYGSLVLSLVSVIIAFHLSILMATYDTHSSSRNSLFNVLGGERGRTRGYNRLALFVFQAPIMLLSYSVLSYLSGLALLVLSPFYSRIGSPDDKKIAITFIVYVVSAAFTYIIISLSVYTKLLCAVDQSYNKDTPMAHE